MSEFDEHQTVEEFLFGPCSRSALAALAHEDEKWENFQEWLFDHEETFIEELKDKEKRWLFRSYNKLLNISGS